jgi:hypothetical protein
VIRPEIEEWIVVERDSWKSVLNGAPSGAWLMHEFLLRNGKRFVSQPKPERYKMRQPKACFWNAARLAKRSRVLRYAEGYVASPDIPILIHHAWNVDREDRVVDVTLQDWKTGESRAGNAQYFGIVFEAKHLPKEGGSMLDSGRGYRIDLWLALDPGFIEFLPKEFALSRNV